MTVIDLKDVEKSTRESMGWGDEQAAEKVPQLKLEETVMNIINRDKRAGKRLMYVFDNFPCHTSATEFARFVREKLRCPPDYILLS